MDLVDAELVDSVEMEFETSDDAAGTEAASDVENGTGTENNGMQTRIYKAGNRCLVLIEYTFTVYRSSISK